MLGKSLKKSKGSKGFTLVELLIVVAIIGILAAIAIPQYAKYRERAAKASAISDAKNVANYLEAYYADYESYPASLAAGHEVGIGSETFTLSKNNTLVGYTAIGNPATAYRFSITNRVYSKSVIYDSSAGGLNKDAWK